MSPDETKEGTSSCYRRALAHAKTLLELVASFPTYNPSSSTESSGTGPQADQQPASDGGIDISSLLAQIRSRYRLLCAALGVRPRLVAAQPLAQGGENAPAEGIDGPAKGVDTKQLLY